MVEFVLILTLIGNDSRSGAALDHIPGFRTEAECLQAGNQWLKQVEEANHQSWATVRPRAMCVRQSLSATANGGK